MPQSPPISSKGEHCIPCMSCPHAHFSFLSHVQGSRGPPGSGGERGMKGMPGLPGKQVCAILFQITWSMCHTYLCLLLCYIIRLCRRGL